jgi:hypothetical protein
MVRDRRACGERRLDMHYAADRRCVLPGQNEPSSHISFHAVGGPLTPPSPPPLLSTFMDGNLSPVRRPMHITAGLGVDRRGGQAGPQVRASRGPRAMINGPSSDGRPDHQTVPTDRCWSARRRGAVGTHPTAREFRSSIRYLRGGFRLLMRTPRRLLQKFHPWPRAGAYYRQINTNSTNIRAHGDEIHRRASGSVQYDTTVTSHTAP